MSYAIVQVVYGVPLTEECSELIDKWEADPTSDKWFEDDNGTCGFHTLYSASGPHYGYCGVQLSTLSSYENELVEDVRMVPTEEEKQRAETMVAALDPELRALTGKIGVYFIWSDS